MNPCGEEQTGFGKGRKGVVRIAMMLVAGCGVLIQFVCIGLDLMLEHRNWKFTKNNVDVMRCIGLTLCFVGIAVWEIVKVLEKHGTFG